MSISPVSSSTSSQAAYRAFAASLDQPNISTLSVLSAAAAQQTQQVNLNAIVAYESTSLYGSGLNPTQFSIQSIILNTFKQISIDTQELVAQLKADAEQAAADLANLNIWGFIGDVVSGTVNVISNAAKTLTTAISGLFGIVVGLMSEFLGFTSWRLADQQLNSSELLGGPNAALTVITEENSLNALIPYVNTGAAISKIGNVVTAKGIEFTDKLSAQDLAQTIDAENTATSVSLSATASVAVGTSAEAATTVASMIQQPDPPRSESHQPAPLDAAATQASTSQLAAIQATQKRQANSALDDLKQIASLEKHHLVAEAQQAKLLLTSLRNSAEAANQPAPPRKDQAKRFHAPLFVELLTVPAPERQGYPPGATTNRMP